MDTKKAYDELFNLLLYKGVLDVNEEVCNIFINYIKARLYDLGIENTKVHFFLREERMEKNATGSSFYAYRYNPFTKEPCKEKWNHGTRAFNKDGEVFIDFGITDNYYRKRLSDYKLVSNLIDFIFTLEHELRHTIQKNKKVAKVIDYDNYRYEKDLLVLNFTAMQNDKQNQAFYWNAHNNMFLEIDANNQASKFIDAQIRERGIGHVIIHQFQDRKYSIDGVVKKRKEEAYLKKEKLDYDFKMLFGLGIYQEEVKVDIDPQKIIDILSDEIILTNPRVLYDYPTLSYVYNKDGKKKTYWELKKLMQEKPELTSFLNEVIENDVFLKIQKMEDEMVRSYCNTRELNSKNKIIDTYIDKIKSIVEIEHFSIDNLLSYYDRRLLELQKSNESIEYKNTAKLIVLLTKQIMLRKGYLERANARITNLKMNFPTCLQIVEEKCHLKINLAEGSRIPYLNSLNSLIANYRNNRNYWIKQGLSEEEYQQIIQALEVCRHFVSRQGYLLNEEIVENEKVKSLAPGTNSLYATNYYLYKINELRNDPVELSQFEELFKITDEIFRQCQKHVGATGTDMETSAYTVLGRNPLITKMLEIHPEILDILHEIKNSEERKGYVTRIEAAIFVCEEHQRDLEKKLL